MDNLFGRRTHADESSHDDGHKHVRHEILVVHQRISALWSISGEQGADDSQYRCYQRGHHQILHVGHLGAYVALQEYHKLLYCSRLALSRLGYVRYLGLLVVVGAPGFVVHVYLVPLLRRDLALRALHTRTVQSLLVDDIQYHLGVEIATRRTHTRIGIGIASSLLEIRDSVNGVAVIHRVAPLVEQPQAVKQLVYVAAGLMDIDDNQPPSIRLLFE